MLHASFMASPQGGVSAHYSGYAGYTPPPGAYNIHQHYQQPQHVDQRSSDSPLDFSAAASQYGNNSSAWNDEMRNYEDNKVIGFSDVNPSNGVDRTSSPDYRYGWILSQFDEIIWGLNECGARKKTVNFFRENAACFAKRAVWVKAATKSFE